MPAIETINPPEQLSEQHFFELLSRAGNHEAKLITLLLLAEAEGGALTGAEIVQATNSAQGDDPGWEIGRNNYLGQDYCRNSLVHTGSVERGTTTGPSGRPAETWGITEFGSVHGVALAGFLLDWSYRHPEIGLQQVFGSSNTAGDTRAPETRYKVIWDLLHDPAGKPGFSEIAGPREMSLPDIHKTAHAMQKDGLLTIEEVTNLDERRFAIGDPTFKHKGHDFSEISPEYRLIYRTLKAVKDTEKPEISVREFLEIAAQINTEATDLTKVRGYIVKALTSQGRSIKAIPAITPLTGDEGKFNNGNHSKFQLKPELVDALGELTVIIDLLRSNDQEVLKTGQALAHSIITDPRTVSLLMAKARSNSPNVHQMDLDRWQSIIEPLVKETDSLTIDQLQQMLKEKGAPRVTDTHLEKLLGKLSSRGVVIISRPSQEFYRRKNKSVAPAGVINV